MKTIVLAVVFATLILSSNIYGQEKSKDGNLAEAQLKIQIVIGKTVLSATMHNNPTTMDFLSMLPLTLKLEDYAKTEKISYLPRKLSVKDAPSGSDPSPGDISYYSPWGNLAIFYRDFGYSNGLIILGKLDSGIELLSKYEGSIEVRLMRS
jgi:hypothetical protein